jgi:hypothetical protein
VSIHGKATSILGQGVDFSRLLNSVSYKDTTETAETSGFQQDSKTYIAGRDDATADFGGRFQGNSDSFEAMIRAEILAQAFPIFTVGFGMGLKVGQAVAFGSSLATAIAVTSPVGDVVSISGSVQFSDGTYDGQRLNTSAQVAVSESLAGIDNGAALASTTYGFALHLVENTSDGATTVRVEHSTDGAVWADLVTFADIAAGTLGAELVKFTGVVNRYVRVGVTYAGTTGAVRPLVSFGTH